SLKAADAALQELIAACQGRESALEVVRLGGKYALQLRREAIAYGRRLAPQEIPGHLLRTLALVAHEQPMLQSELKRRLGDRVYEHVGELLELGMLERERAGRSFALSVTEAFDEYFGISATTQAERRAFLEQALGAS
ncbi:MAG: SMC-Scp complex subunit ScpB, partial [Candidatus Thermoplasmatota archaeon]|nr:SMC-Scp complex subunit ScpB [Candidatus Thermoplasmatota archaeon]